MFKVTAGQLRKMLLYMVRDEAFLGHTEFYQIPSKFRFCYNRERGEFDSFTYCGKELGREISDDTVFTVGMQNFQFPKCGEVPEYILRNYIPASETALHCFLLSGYPDGVFQGT